MTVVIKPLEADAIFRVATRMRVADRIECEAYLAPEAATAASLAFHGSLMSVAGGVAWWNDTPVAAIGVTQLAPRLFQAWMFATPAWPLVALPMTRYAIGPLRNAILARGATALFADAIAWRKREHRWLKLIGATIAVPLPNLGRGGEDFIRFSWPREVDPVCFSAPKPPAMIPPPSRSDADIMAQSQAEARRRALAGGATPTVATSPTGVPGPAPVMPVAIKSLLG